MFEKRELIEILRNSPNKKEFKALLEMLIDEEIKNLITCNENELKYLQGIIRAYQKILKIFA